MCRPVGWHVRVRGLVFQCAEQEEYTRLADEWRVRYANELAVAEAEVTRLTGIREQQRQTLLRFQERYDKELAELAEKEVRARARVCVGVDLA